MVQNYDMEKLLEQLNAIHTSIKSTIDSNSSIYDIGIYNGMEMALSGIEGREPEYISPPDLTNTNNCNDNYDDIVDEYTNSLESIQDESECDDSDFVEVDSEFLNENSEVK